MAVPVVLTIAGSDSSGGAGLQADLKTFGALGVYGTCAITAVTAQNTLGVKEIHVLAPEMVTAQIDAVFADTNVSALKIGMLPNAAIVRAVARAIRIHKPKHAILDPVMAATSGDPLVDLEAVDAMRSHLLPIVTLVTPNIVETAVLLKDAPVRLAGEMADAAAKLLALGATAVLIKGGDLGGEGSPDYLHDGWRPEMIEGARVETDNTHGTGCTLSAAIAAYLALGDPLADAVKGAKTFVAAALKHADRLDIGGGPGPLHHFHAHWPELPVREEDDVSMTKERQSG